MAYKEENKLHTITCDKCGYEETAKETDLREEVGKKFFYRGWTANFRAKKYVHICYSCQTKKQKSTTDWVRARF